MISENADVCKEVLAYLGFFDKEVIKRIPSDVLKKINKLSLLILIHNI